MHIPRGLTVSEASCVDAYLDILILLSYTHNQRLNNTPAYQGCTSMGQCCEVLTLRFPFQGCSKLFHYSAQSHNEKFNYCAILQLIQVAKNNNKSLLQIVQCTHVQPISVSPYYYFYTWGCHMTAPTNITNQALTQSAHMSNVF